MSVPAGCSIVTVQVVAVPRTWGGDVSHAPKRADRYPAVPAAEGRELVGWRTDRGCAGAVTIHVDERMGRGSREVRDHDPEGFVVVWRVDVDVLGNTRRLAEVVVDIEARARAIAESLPGRAL